MKILLINPPFYKIMGFFNRYFPFALVQLGTILRNHGHEVLVYDGDFVLNPQHSDYSLLPKLYPDYLKSLKDENSQVWLDLEKVLDEFNPEVVGISIYTTYIASSYHVANVVRKVLPQCKIIYGGPHTKEKYKEVCENVENFDYILRGMCDLTLPQLVSSIQNDNCSLDRISGLTFKSDGHYVHNPIESKMIDLSVLPIPDRSLLYNNHLYLSEDMGMIMTSRGCPYSCSFCSTDTSKISYRPTEQVIEEVIEIKRQYGTIQFTFKDDSFTVNKARVKELCSQIISRKLKICWECNTRVNHIDEKLLILMKKAGCNFVKVGVESGSEIVLKKMEKTTTLKKCREAANLFRKVGIHWTAYFLIGIPGERERDIIDTLNFMKEIKPDMALFGVYEPFPGTAMFHEGIEKELVKPKMSFEEFNSTNPNDYYKSNAKVQNDTIEWDRFKYLENMIKNKARLYNKKYVNIFRMFKAKFPVYRLQPSILKNDFKKYLGY
ncbi:MAG: B12-binding domain-containing radical SAM protein [Planctomycetota bacterium]|jgi:radical SAM superfamily enzyme YgiQ (UPF0313 family)